MPTPEDGRSVLAVAIDAAEPSLVSALLDKGRLPALSAVLARGSTGRVVARADLGSGAVWPTFSTGLAPQAHGFYSDVCWQPAAMQLRRASFSDLTPFWARLARDGVRSAVLDVPFVPLTGAPGSTEVLDWGAHDWLGGTPLAAPASAVRLVRSVGTHPFARHVCSVRSPADRRGLRRALHDCVVGVRRRGELASRLIAAARASLNLVVFTEAHRASHYLWPAAPGGGADALDEVFAEIDRQIGRLVNQAGDATTVFVFSLHGMRAANGIPDVLDTLLEAWGCATRAVTNPAGGRRSWRPGVLAMMPEAARTWYHRFASRATVMRLARPEAVLPQWDWRRTRAFSLPTDQHGWIRVNLAGRESQGIVSPADYEATCQDLTSRLMAVRTCSGRRVVDRVLHTRSRRRARVPFRFPISWFTGARRPSSRRCAWPRRLWSVFPLPPSSPVSTRPKGSTCSGPDRHSRHLCQSRCCVPRMCTCGCAGGCEDVREEGHPTRIRRAVAGVAIASRSDSNVTGSPPASTASRSVRSCADSALLLGIDSGTARRNPRVSHATTCSPSSNSVSCSRSPGRMPVNCIGMSRSGR